MISFLQELGSTWSWLALVLVLLSAILRSSLPIAFAGGIAITLYLHPASTDGTSRRSYAFKRSREKLDLLSRSRTMSDDVFESMEEPIRMELEYFLDHVIDDYVKWWYKPPVFLSETRFPLACKQSLQYSIGQLYSSLIEKDPVFYFEALFTNCVATISVVLTDLRGANKLKSKDDPLGLHMYSKTNPGSPLARLLSRSESQANSRCCAQSVSLSIIDGLC